MSGRGGGVVLIERPTAGPRRRTLAEAYSPRANSMDVLRLLLAGTVALVHSSDIAYGHQPHLGRTEVGALAVDGFFVLSGFLITASFLRLGAPVKFVWHRFLRIMPAFWAVLLLTAFVVAPLMAVLEGRPAGSALASSWTYVTHNALLYISDFSVGGMPQGTARPGVINGALWTLFFEAACYGLVFVLGVAGLLQRRRWVPVALTVLAWLGLVADELGVPMRGELFVRFFFVFLLGALAYLFRDRLPMSGWWVAAAAVLLVLSTYLLVDYRPLGGLAFAYLTIYAMACTPWLRRRLRVDLSYGVYVLHWPVMVILVLAGATALTQFGYTLLAMAVTFALAWVSWTVLESRCLDHKDSLPPKLARIGAPARVTARAGAVVTRPGT